jgi:hypothetical protein
MPATHHWHLYKAADGEVHGPVDLDQLKAWAAEAKIAPQDRVSDDGMASWRRATLVEDLQMDWLIEMPDKYLYGPTSVSTIQEFLATGEIDDNVVVVNTVDRTSGRLADQPFYQASPHSTRSASTTHRGTLWPSELEHAADHMLVRRVQWLEKQVMELQRELGVAEQINDSLRAQFVEATGRDPL